MSVDPSLTCSGWALFSITAGELLAVGKIRSLSPEAGLAVRLKDLQDKVQAVLGELGLGRNDVLVCEAPTTMRDPGAAFKVEQVRCIFEAVARTRAIVVPGRLNPRSVQFEVIGLRGRQSVREEVKAAAVQVAAQLYGSELKAIGFDSARRSLGRNQDIVDALLIGHLAVSRVKSAIVSQMSLEQFFEERKSKRRLKIR